MEILKRAKQFQSGEGVSAFESEANVRDEVNRRTHKAGYTNRDGGPPTTGKIMTTVAFGEVKYNLWPRDKNGKLIE